MQTIGKNARIAALSLGVAPERVRNDALRAMADGLRQSVKDICAANAQDIQKAADNGIAPAMVDRLRLDEGRVEDIARSIESIIALPDPLGKTDAGWTRPNGLKIERVRVPLGVIGVIYESRPNVTADAAALCVKSGNACILRGGKEALRSNIAIGDCLRGAIARSGLPADCVQVISDPSREKALELMRLWPYVDVLIPRGGAELIDSVVQNANVPVIQTGTGVCHTYVDRDCDDLAVAMAIVENAKISRPSVCNSMETLLVDEAIAQSFLPDCAKRLETLGVELRGCERSRQIVPSMKAATEDDWWAEYLDLILAVKIVSGLEQAIDHINTYGTHHSECILTNNLRSARRFEQMVDAAAVYVNASTRFTDGGEFGFGAEIGISNQKLHARGPVGLAELTTTKYLIKGDGQIR